ncbi:MAG: ABC transporter permease, partial [Chitinophagaceae bacterium]|nr:ABC transporter permease [Chitinophagaceae bacterium]
GLSVGVTVCLLIVFFIKYDKGWDKMHTKSDRIYRVNEAQDFPGSSPMKVAYTMFPMGPTIKQEFSQVDNFARLFPASQKQISNGENKLVFNQSFWVDPSFFQVFDFTPVDGDIKTALSEPYAAVLTESSAKKIFGTANVVGKTFLRDTTPFKVNAVLKDVPENSHLQFEALFSIITINNDYIENWGENNSITYLLLRPGTNPANLESRFPAYLARHLLTPEQVKGYKLYLQPLNKIHLGSAELAIDDFNFKSFNGSYISVFIVLAIIIVVIAFINFINLSIASSATRAKEVGIKKTIGANRRGIAVQFISETVFLTLLSFTLALFFSFVALRFLNQLTDRSIELPLFLQPLNFIFFFGIAVVLGILAGLYPSFYISSFQTIKVLKGKVFEPNQKFPVRNVLVTGQFTIAIALIIAALLVNQQLNYMQNQDPGFEKEQVVILPASIQSVEKKNVLQNKLLNTKGVKDVSYSGQRLGTEYNQGFTRYESPSGKINEASVAFLRIDERFIPLYKLQLLKGRNFSNTIASDSGQAYIINESMAKEMGWKDPIGKTMACCGSSTPMGKIIGVVKDFHFSSLKKKIEPMLLAYVPSFKEISVKIEQGNIQQTIQKIKSTWDEIITDRPFEYTFLDEHFAKIYKTELQLSRVTNIAASLSIFIACLGILGLVSIIIQQRVKEIGIRKVLGATVGNIVFLFSKGVMRLVFIAFVIAFPVAWWAMNKWLQDFAYRISIQ